MSLDTEDADDSSENGNAAVSSPAAPFAGAQAAKPKQNKPQKGLRGAVSSVMNVLAGRTEEKPVTRTICMSTSQAGFVQEPYLDDEGITRYRNIAEFVRIPGQNYEVAEPEASRLVETGQAQFVETAAA